MGGKDHIGEANKRLNDQWDKIHNHTTEQDRARGFMRSPGEALHLARVKKALKDAEGNRSLTRLKTVEGIMKAYIEKYVGE